MSEMNKMYLCGFALLRTESKILGVSFKTQPNNNHVPRHKKQYQKKVHPRAIGCQNLGEISGFHGADEF